MKISRELRTLPLHDSDVKHILYSPEEKRLVLELTLCDLPDRRGEAGQLVFYGVMRFTSNPPLASIQWDSGVGADIQTLKHVPENDEGDLEAVSWLMLLMRGGQWQDMQVFTAEFLAESFDWIAGQ